MRLLSLALLLSLTACGTSNDSQQNAETTPAVSANADKLLGTYAMEVFISSIGDTKFIGKTTSSGGIYRLAEITKTDDGYQIREKTCTATFNSPGAKMSVSDAQIRKTPDSVAKLEVSEKDGTIQFSRKVTLVAGAKLTNPETDALPSNSKDPRVIDKGIEASVAFGPFSGSANYVGRSKNTITAALGEKGVIKGSLLDASEQTIIQVSTFLMNFALGPVLSTQDLERENSVTMLPVAATSTCDSVKFKTLFGR